MVPSRAGVEHFETHLQALSLCDGDHFGETQVEIFIVRPTQLALSLVPIGAWRGQGEDAPIEPFGVASSEAAFRTPGLIRPVAVIVAAAAVNAHLIEVRAVIPVRRERTAGSDGVDAARLPPAQNPVGRSQRPPLAFAHRQLPGSVRRQAIGLVEAGGAVVGLDVLRILDEVIVPIDQVNRGNLVHV
jgi:hypothetical protein